MLESEKAQLKENEEEEHDETCFKTEKEEEARLRRMLFGEHGRKTNTFQRFPLDFLEMLEENFLFSEIPPDPALHQFHAFQNVANRSVMDLVQIRFVSHFLLKILILIVTSLAPFVCFSDTNGTHTWFQPLTRRDREFLLATSHLHRLPATHGQAHSILDLSNLWFIT